MNDLIGKCGRYLWSEVIEPKDWICKSSFDLFVAQHSLGQIYHCVGREEEYVVIQASRNEKYKVNPIGFDVVEYTPYFVGDRVKVKSGSKTGEVATISGIGWHLKNKTHLFILNFSGKKSSRHYLNSDIELY